MTTMHTDAQGQPVTLSDARALDPFNLSTTNYLRLLDDMDKFAQKETEHFILLYDAEK